MSARTSERARGDRSASEEGQPEALDLLEDGVHLLRGLPIAAFAPYLAGTVPFLLGLLFFVADMSRDASAGDHLTEAALLLAVLYVAMRTAKARFCRTLYEALLRRRAPSKPRLLRVVEGQACLAPWGVFAVGVAALLFVPLAWAVAFHESVAVLGAVSSERPQGLARRAIYQASLWPAQNHRLLALFSVFALFVFLNVGVSLVAFPALAKTLLGIESPFTRGEFHPLNTTFLGLVSALSFLVLDPLLKAVYTIRCFHGEALATGEDLLAALPKRRETDLGRTA